MHTLAGLESFISMTDRQREETRMPRQPATRRTQGSTSAGASARGQARTETGKNQTKASNRQSGMHQRPAAKRESTRESRASQSKLTSTGSRAAEEAASATPEEERTRDQLYQRAAQLGINGRSRMTKADLVDAIRSHSKR